MKFDQIMEKVEINHIDSLSIYQSLIFNIDEESKIEYSNGNKYWLLNGKRHRTDGPAVERSDGSKCWLLHGKYHRTDGPAIGYSDGSKSWYLNGKRYSEEKYNEKVKNEI